MNNSNKFLLLIPVVLILVLLGAFLLGYCCNEKENVDLVSTDSLQEDSDKPVLAKNIYKDIVANITTESQDPEDFKDLRLNISLDDIALIKAGIYTGDNSLAKLGQEFMSSLQNSDDTKLTENINGGISIDTLNSELEKIPEELKRDIVLKLEIFDNKTGDLIPSGMVFVNGIKIGNFENGKFVGEFRWLKGIEDFSILVRSEEYGDAMVDTNSINSSGRLVKAKLYMKKARIKQVTLGKEQRVLAEKTFIKIGNCSLTSKSGDCFVGEVKMKVNSIEGEDANMGNLSLSRRAITKEGKVVNLRSGGMAYIDFIDDDGNILKVDEENKITIQYKVSDEDIATMDDKTKGAGNGNGYWFFNKNIGLREEFEADFNLDRERRLWTVTTSKIY